MEAALRAGVIGVVAAGLTVASAVERWGGCAVTGVDASPACLAAQSANYYAASPGWPAIVAFAAALLAGLALAELALAFRSRLAPWIAGVWTLSGLAVGITTLGWLDDRPVLGWLALPFSLAWVAAPLVACLLIATSRPIPRAASIAAVIATALICPAGEAAVLQLAAGRGFADVAPWTGIPAAIGLLMVAATAMWLNRSSASTADPAPTPTPHQP